MMSKRGVFLIIILLCIFPDLSKAGTVLNSDWSDVVSGKCSDQTTAWWSSAEAVRIAENVMLYQKDCGGWTKNINMQLVLTDAQKSALIADKPKNTACCIDNSAVTLELLYLSKVFKAINDETEKSKIKEAFVKGILYYLKAQYANGGWPQYYPYRGGYSNNITYNDNAMINVMNNLRHVYQKDTYYSITVADSIVSKAKTAFDKGVVCILKTQYIQNNKLSVWCAQHDYITLVPVMARSYELASLSGAESANIITLLMSLSNPSKEIKRAIYSSVAWYDRSRIKGQRLDSFTNSDGLSDKRIVNDASASDMWARFYTLADNRPFFCDRDGIIKYSLAEIGYERRNGYSWYNTSGNGVFSSYNTWLPKWGTTILASPLTGARFYSTDSIPVMAFANKNTGSGLKKFDLTVDSQAPQTFSTFAINTSLKGLAPGSHTLVVKSEYENGNIESDTCSIDIKSASSLSTLSGNKNELRCYPNPSTNWFFIDMQSTEMSGVEIFNVQGQMVFNASQLQRKLYIDSKTLAPGIYFIRVIDINNDFHIQKVIVEP
jgi:PelA/Pel-15E family pectate lyase